MTQTSKAYLAIVTQIVIVGLSFIFVKEGLGYTDTFTQLSHRFIVASLGMVSIRLISKNKKALNLQMVKELLPLAIFYPVLFFSLQTMSLNHISTLEGGIVTATIPILILILASIFLKEKTSILQKSVIFIAFFGVLYINIMGQTEASNFNLWGTLLMFFSALSSAMYTITAKKVSKKYDALDMTTFMLLFGMLVFTIISLFQHTTGIVTTSYFEPLTHSPYVLSVLYLGLLSSLGSAFLSNYAIHHVPASTVGLFSNLSPVIMILSGVIVLNEPIYSYQIIGILVILIPIIGMNVIQKKLVKTTSVTPSK
ncbi:DMT family transporter [Vagococcus fluvialis]|uniref:DMT family transporter n=1 Tax=Vagococcus fluvialis TaxID=2738 RepID=A0A7X6D8E7_9ENTE|nr:DMT family transporter [Vagococcus fluvialis]NKC67717.1 DMT family transporter [Vagococcus fluvialis]